MCSGCSGGYHDDYEEPEGDDLDLESGSPASRLAPRGQAKERERMNAGQEERFHVFDTDEPQPHVGPMIRSFEGSYEVLVGPERIVEIRVVRRKESDFRGLRSCEPPNELRGHRSGCDEKMDKNYQTYAIGYPPYGRAEEQSITRLFIFLLTAGLAALGAGTFTVWILLR